MLHFRFLIFALLLGVVAAAPSWHAAGLGDKDNHFPLGNPEQEQGERSEVESPDNETGDYSDVLAVGYSAPNPNSGNTQFHSWGQVASSATRRHFPVHCRAPPVHLS